MSPVSTRSRRETGDRAPLAAERKSRAAKAVAVGVLAIAALVALKNGEKPKDPAVYEGSYYIPADGQVHREVIAGDTMAGISLANLGSIRDAIHKVNPNISKDEAIDLLQAENVAHQRDMGVPADKIDPNAIAGGQGFDLPDEWGVGHRVTPDKP
jgi:hypothetical protein